MKKKDGIISLIIVILAILIDQLTKWLIVKNFDVYESVKIIGNFFKLTYVQNDGAAFSLFEGNMVFLFAITVVGLIAFVYLLSKTSLSKNKFELLSLSMMIGGLFGNFIDRIRLGYVVDMLDFLIFGYDFPVFNVADMFLCIGTFIYILVIFKEEKWN